MEEKKADNKIIQTKNELRNTEDMLDDTKKILKSIQELEENFLHLNKNINLCIGLLNSSMNNKKVMNTIDSMNKDVQRNYNKTTSNIYDEKEMTIKKINDLNDKIDELNKTLKQEFNNNENEKLENDKTENNE